MTLNDNVHPWNDMGVIVETNLELCGHEDQAKEVECYVEELKYILLAKNFDITESISITEVSFE